MSHRYSAELRRSRLVTCNDSFPCLFQSPPKGQTIPYRPKPISSIVTGSPIIANGHHSVLGGGAGLGVGGHPGLTGTPAAAFSPGMPMAAANNFLSTAYGLHPAAANHSPQFLPTAAAQSTHEVSNIPLLFKKRKTLYFI